MIESKNIYLGNLRKTNGSSKSVDNVSSQMVNRTMAKCIGCKKRIVPDKKYYYIGEIIICDHCGKVYHIQDNFGFMKLVEEDGSASRSLRLIRHFNQKVRYRLKLTGRTILYFSDENLANRYSNLLRSCGQTISWYGESVTIGRLPEMDTIIDDIELYAVSS